MAPQNLPVSPPIVVHPWVTFNYSVIRFTLIWSPFFAVFPSPWGRDLTKEEAYIQKLDGSTGASLKLTVLNPEGRVWTMVAGGGASVVYRCVIILLALAKVCDPDYIHASDAIAAHGFAHELANYGEYSGAPTEGQTYEYAKTIGTYFSLIMEFKMPNFLCLQLTSSPVVRLTPRARF